MAAQNVAEFGNLLITFGEPPKEELPATEASSLTGMLDHPEFVLPLFFKPETRETHGAQYFVHRAELVTVAEQRAIVFEFVKVHDLKSFQQWGPGGITSKKRQLPNDAPSAVGVLVLNNHRLVYVGKTPNAPTVNQFASTLQYGVKGLYQTALQKAKGSAPRGEKVAAEAAFKAKCGVPHVEYVRIIGQDNVAEAIKAFAIIRSMSLVVHAPNPEEYEPGSLLLARLRALRMQTGAKKTTLNHSNSTGLNPGAVRDQLSEAAGDDHTSAKIQGTNKQGGDETWDDQKLTLRVGVDVDLTHLKAAAGSLVATMNKELKGFSARSSPIAKVTNAVEWLESWLK